MCCVGEDEFSFPCDTHSTASPCAEYRVDGVGFGGVCGDSCCASGVVEQLARCRDCRARFRIFCFILLPEQDWDSDSGEDDEDDDDHEEFKEGEPAMFALVEVMGDVVQFFSTT